jgi:ATP-dependent Lon protease
MVNTCKYIFQKGEKRGIECKKEILGKNKYCKIHNPKKKTSGTTIIDKNIDIVKKILELDTSNDNKNIILKFYNNMKKAESNSTEYYKNQLYVERIINFPWNKMYNIKDLFKTIDVKSFIFFLKNKLDAEIYGMDNVKNEIINIVCKLITNPNGNRNNIALYGAAGVGKSKFIKVLAEVLGIPMKTISLGGIKDSSFLLGHNYIYVESGPGKIIQNIIDSKINNPILMFDEVDKVSESEQGKDVYSFLCYLTDNTQNTEFMEHYFYGIKFDLSKVFYVFTFNDITKIDKILLDRLNIIYVDKPNDNDIINIIHTYCIPEIIKNIGIKNNIIITKEHIKFVINYFKKINLYDKNYSSGIREFYRIFEKIFLYINKDILLDLFDNELITEDILTNYMIHIELNYEINNRNNNHHFMYI